MLNERQIRFCEEYLCDFNATKAAIRAGYTKNSAGQVGHELLKHHEIQLYLNDKKEKIYKKLEITQERVMEAYARLAFYDPRKFYDENGNLKKVIDLDDETAYALQGFEQEAERKRGEFSESDKADSITVTSKIKLTDRRAALDSICRVKGWNAPDKMDMTSGGQPVNQILKVEIVRAPQLPKEENADSQRSSTGD